MAATNKIVRLLMMCCMLGCPSQCQGSGSDAGVRIPASARPVPLSRRRRSLLTEPEFEAFEKQIVHEEMSHEEKSVHRRKGVPEYRICEDTLDSSYSKSDKKQQHCYIPGVQVSILYGEHMNFCVNCADPHVGGSRVDMWGTHFGPMHYHVDGLVVYAVPNRAQRCVPVHVFMNMTAVLFVIC
jgi:hypothetical protein